MTCKTPFNEILWKRIRIDIPGRPCPACGQTALCGGEELLPFDNAIVSMWKCTHCSEEVAFIVSENGDVYRS